MFGHMGRMFTGGSKRNKTGIDYMMTKLLYEHLDVIRRIVEADVEDATLNVNLKKEISAFQNHLRFYYLPHISSDDVALNSVKHAIMDRKRTPQCLQSSNCTEFMKPFQIMKDIRTVVGENSD